MKYLVLILCLSSLWACSGELSQKEREELAHYINLHNSEAKTQMDIALIKEETEYKIRHMDQSKEEWFSQKLRSHLNLFAMNYNQPYDIRKDTALTVEKYLQYCKAHNYAPKEYIQFLK